jgi:regulator of sirC expression with transglutaminase-like and TPR domain
MAEKIINKELDALVSLIDEPDANMFGQVRQKIFSYGLDAIPALENAWDTSSDNHIQNRIETIIHQIQFEHVFQELKLWKKNMSHDLLKGFILVANYQYPDLDEKWIIEQVGKIIQDVWLELNNNLTPLEKVKVLNHIFFDVNGFRDNKKEAYTPNNSFINNILESRKGNPVSLSILYMVVAQSLKIPIYGVNLPQEFIMAYMGGMINDLDSISEKDVQFYLNAKNKGAAFTRREIEQFLMQLNLEKEHKYFLPCDNITIIRRVLNNLLFSHQQAGNIEKSEEIKKLQSALD